MKTILLSVAATLTVVASCTSILCGFGVIHIGLGRVPEKEESVASLTDKSSADLTSSDEPESETESDTESGSTTDTTAITTASGMNNQTTANNDKNHCEADKFPYAANYKAYYEADYHDHYHDHYQWRR